MADESLRSDHDVVLGTISFTLVIGFVFSSEPLDPVGRTGLPALMLELLAAAAGIACVTLGVRGLRRSR